MSWWAWILLASLVAAGTKLLGYLVPSRLLDNERMASVTSTLTIGLLASLVALNAVGGQGSLVFDARLAALGAAAVALLLRAPFILVVVIGAVAAALARFLGMS